MILEIKKNYCDAVSFASPDQKYTQSSTHEKESMWKKVKGIG